MIGFPFFKLQYDR